MKKPLLSLLVPAALAALLSLPGTAAAQQGCMDNAAIQAAIASGAIAPVSQVLARQGIPGSTQVLSVRVCEQGGVPHYILAVLEASGEARNLTLPAR